MNYTKTNGQVTKAPTPSFGAVICLILCCVTAAWAQTTAFTYQGRLTDAGNPANADYDLQFKLFDALAGGAQQGGTLVRTPVPTSAGNFTVTLDFGANVFSGANRYVEIGVRPANSAIAYTVLSPRQPINSTPYAIRSMNSTQLGGVDASQYVTTSTVGNAFIKNETAPQTNASFNIDGNGTLGGKLVVNGGVGIGFSNPNPGQLYVLGSTPGGSAVYGESASGPGVHGKSTGSRGVFGESEGVAGVWGANVNGAGVVGASINGYGVQGTTASVSSFAGYFTNTGGGHGVYSETPTGRAIWGKSTSSRGVYGESVSNVGVWGISGSSTGVVGLSTSGYGVDGSSASATGFGGHFSNTGGGKALKVEGTGSISVVEITGGSDLAEKFEVEDETKPGMVVAIDPRNVGRLSIARGAYNRRVAGIISGANNLSAGMVLPDLAGDKTTFAQPVALTGRVWAYCDATKNAIRPGDLLTTATTPGHAMKVVNHTRAQGAIIGKAMTELKSGKGLVLVLVSLQ